MNERMPYDLIVIGSGPAGENAATHATANGFKVAMIERQPVLGGAGVNTGTLPSKTLKETALYLAGTRDRGLYSVERTLEHRPDVADFLFREKFVVRTEAELARLELLKDKVDILYGTAAFLDPHHISVTADGAVQVISGRFILVATGSSPRHPAGIPFDGHRVHDSDTILKIDRIPESLCIVGAGTIGCEYATIFATLGTQVTLLNSGDELLTFLDGEIVARLQDAMRASGIDLRMKVRVDNVRLASDSAAVTAEFTDGRTMAAEMFLYTAGRGGNVEALQCDKAGLTPTSRGLLGVDDTYRTSVPNIYAAGDIIGFPALGSTSMDQGRVAVTHMFGLHEVERVASVIPYGIYTIPEISMVGLTEEQAREQGVDYGVARACYADVPRGIIMGAEQGLLKILYRQADLRVLGVHIIGAQATELIHYGMELLESSRDLSHVVGTVFNFPTLHELYKRAATEAWERASFH